MMVIIAPSLVAGLGTELGGTITRIFTICDHNQKTTGLPSSETRPIRDDSGRP